MGIVKGREKKLLTGFIIDMLKGRNVSRLSREMAPYHKAICLDRIIERDDKILLLPHL